MSAAPIPYSPDVEQVQPDEADTQQAIIDTFHGIVDTTNRDYGHAYRGVHAKSHALLEGELAVLDGLPPELAQGAFAEGGRRYPAVLRISTTPGDPLPDTVSVPRGLAIKLVGVAGARLPGSEGDATQDFVLAVGPAFFAADAPHFLQSIRMLAATTDKAETGKVAVSAALRVADKALEMVGVDSAKVKSMGGYPHTHPLGERYYSQAALRWGDYVAKLAVVPLSPNFKALERTEIDIAGRADALREEIAQVLAAGGGAWELRVQLRRDADANPVEDASQPWPEDDNPYVAVATISVPAQPGWTWQRARVVDDETAFSPWHGLQAHQPLGSVMRARRPAYADLSRYRARLNGCPMAEPREAVHLPG